MSFNLWHSGSNVADGYVKISNAIARADADIVACQEANGQVVMENIVMHLRKMPGYENVHQTFGIISKFPIVDTYPCGAVKVEYIEGFYLHVFNSHLSPYPYGPYEIRDGKMPDESTRLEEIELDLKNIEDKTKDDDFPVLFLGDHNTPSHLDWVKEASVWNYGVCWKWPVSERILENGFVDLFRKKWPSVVANRGLTWTVHNYNGAREKHDRIDFIYGKENGFTIQVEEAFVFAPEMETKTSYNKELEWPSDHRAVVVKISIE